MNTDNANNATPEVTDIENPIAVAFVQTGALQARLALFTKIIPTSRSILVNKIHITISNNAVELYGTTDLAVALRQLTDADITHHKPTVEGFPAIVADYKALTQAVKALKDQQTRIEMYEDYLIVSDSTGNGRTRISRIGEVECFPDFPQRLNLKDAITQTEAEYEKHRVAVDADPEAARATRREKVARDFQQFDLSGNALAAGMRYVLPGYAKGDTRYPLGGVYMAGNDHGIELVASNTHHLYKHDVAITAGTLPDGVGFILHPAMAEWLGKHADAHGTITVKTDSHAVFVEGFGFSLAAQQLAGTFPQYRDCIPDQFWMHGCLKFDRKTMLAALKAALPHVYDDDANEKNINLLPNDTGDGLIIQAGDKHGNKVIYSVEIPAASRKWFPERFQIKYLIDFLTVYPGDIVTLRHEEAENKNRYSDKIAVYGGDYLWLLMPAPHDFPTTPEQLEAYRAAITEPDQDFPPVSTAKASTATARKAPSFKAVVSRAKADPGYLAALLSALGMQAAIA